MSDMERCDCWCFECTNRNAGWHCKMCSRNPLQAGERVVHVNVGTLPGTVRSVNLGNGEYPFHVEWDNGLWSLNSRDELRRDPT